MTGREPAQTIDDDAAAWAARIDRGLDVDEQTRLDAWLAIDSRHVGALARSRAIWLHAERADSLRPLISQDAVRALQGAAEPMAEPRSAMVSRRTALFGGGALAAGLAGAIALPALLHRGTALRSGVGEIRRVPLEDGSVVTLDTDSVLEIAFTKASRAVRLRSGAAYFEVADALRPFLVETGGVVLRATASAFSVSALPGLPLAVMVSRGLVELQGEGAGPPIDVVANMRATWPVGMTGIGALKRHSVAPDEIDRLLSWRNGMLSFEGETLGEAAADFRRYGLPVIQVSDATLAHTPITGLFTANDPAGFARAVALSLGIEAHGDGKVVHLGPARSA